MTNFNKTALTDAGLKLLGKEGIPTEFVRVETGCGVYVENEDVAAQTELKSKVQEMGISSVSVVSENKIRLKFVVSNKELDATYLFTEIGVYANDPDEGEILYAICYATENNAEKIQKYNGIFESTIAISLGIEVDNAGNVSFETKGAYALVEDLLETENRIENIEKNYLQSNKVVNNLITTEGGYALDARQGANLSEKIEVIKRTGYVSDFSKSWMVEGVEVGKLHMLYASYIPPSSTSFISAIYLVGFCTGNKVATKLAGDLELTIDMTSGAKEVDITVASGRSYMYYTLI